jgi:hypothetical protein
LGNATGGHAGTCDVEKMQHLIWPIFANPDTNSLYDNVAASVPGVFFRHVGHVKF